MLDGTHATDRLQISVIEGKERLAARFDWLVQGTAGGNVTAFNFQTGKIEFTATQLKDAMDYVLASVTNNAPAESSPVLRIALNGTLDCVSRACILNRSCVVDGLGSAIVRRTASYTNDSTSIFRLGCSNITIRNLTIEDAVTYTQTQIDAYTAPGSPPDDVASQGIIGAQVAPGSENWIFENLVIKNVHHHSINISRTLGTYTRNVTIRNVVVDNLSGQDMGDSSFNVGVGAENVTIENCRFLQPHHGAIDVWAAVPPVRILGCFVYAPRRDLDGRTQNGISVTAVSDSGDLNPTDEILIRDNRVYGDAITQDCIAVHGGASNVVIEGNFVEQSNTTTGRFGIRVGGFTVFRDGSNQTLYGHDVIIRNNHIRNTYSAGIMVESDPTYPFTGVAITGNVIKETRGPSAINLDSDARSVLIANNQIYKTNARQVTSPVGSGIYVRINSPDTLIMGNQMFLDANATYSVFEDGGATTTNKTYVMFNQLATGKPVSFSGANSVSAVNAGYRTENWGTATVAAGSTTQPVTHGLDFTPTAKNILIRPSGAMGSATKFWVSGTPTSTQFTIQVNTAPGGSGASFVWRARRGE